MSDATIQVILERIDNLKEHFNDKFDQIENRLDSQCDNCKNSATFKERLRSQWTHICALWTAVCGLGAYFYNHIVGK